MPEWCPAAPEPRTVQGAAAGRRTVPGRAATERRCFGPEGSAECGRAAAPPERMGMAMREEVLDAEDAGAGTVALAGIREARLSVDEVLDAVADPRAGGTAFFIGTVRDTDEGRPVDALGYSAHPTAAAEMRRVMERVAADASAAGAPVHRVAALHRVGDLAIGDTAVVVAAAAGHRAEAFDACRRLIDEIKAEVPVWKHQRFRDGAAQWVGAE